MHDESTAAVRAYGKTSDEFAVTSGVRQGCVLAPTLFNLFFDAVIRMAIDDHLEEGRGVRIVFNPDAKLVGDRRKMTLETLVADLEYADDMVLLSNSWSDLEMMIKSLHQQCTAWDSPSAAGRQRHWQCCPLPLVHNLNPSCSAQLQIQLNL